MTVVSSYTALLSGRSWHFDSAVTRTPAIVTYNFLKNAQLPEREPVSFYNPFGGHAFSALTAAERAAFRKGLQHMEDVAGIRFVEVPRAEFAQIDIMTTESFQYAGWATYPSDSGSIVVINTRLGNFNPGRPAYETILHELGHVVGLKHPFEGNPTLPGALDNENTTLMSYTSNGRNDVGFTRMDILALRSIYGAPDAFGNDWNIRWLADAQRIQVRGSERGDDLFGVAQGANLLGQGGNDTVTGARGDDTLYGGDGHDTV